MTAELAISHLDRRAIRRFFSKIEVSAAGCWEWTGALDPIYPLAFFEGRTERVHRLMFAWLVSPVPRGIAARRFGQLDHIGCNNKRCCNPVHLALVSQRENTIRAESPVGINSRKTHCKKGHLLIAVPNRTQRDCRQCDSIRHKQRLIGPEGDKYRELGRINQQRYRNRKKLNHDGFLSSAIDRRT